MEPGKVVAGKYRLNQLLGSGGMAEVWSATHTFTERDLAIKFMNAQVAKTPEAAARFLKEAKVSARINHPNVIEIHDVGQTDEGQLFLVMELLHGVCLEQSLRRREPPMSLHRFTHIMSDVAEALAAAHKSGIVHRDLKPSNIFLHKMREDVVLPKLLDFGVSKFLEEDANQALTVAGTVLGSPLYMSPEQARGDANIDGRTDIFAFGAILFEALCGYRAYEANNFNALIVKIATTKPKDIDECAPRVPDSFRAVVRECLDVEPGGRLASFEIVAARLRALLPELAMSKEVLPAPQVAQFLDDTSATPRRSEHVAVGAASGMTRTGAARTSTSIPTSGSATGPSWHTPDASYASVSDSSGPQNHRRAVKIAFAVAVAALVLVTLAVGIGLGWRSRDSGGNASARAAAAGRTWNTSHSPAPSPNANEPPSVSVESLPGAGTSASTSPAEAKPLGPIPRGAGRLLVTATPGWCQLSVDGTLVGPTPNSGADLAAGVHQLRCEPPNGKTKTASVTIQEGATSRIKLPLDE
jgi:serine/threonine-protein kinase